MTTTELPQITTEWSLPVYGLGDYRFNLIHITGLVTLAISILVSFGVLLYTLVLSGKGSLWKRPVGERLVVYLAACDLAWSISHTMDHAYMLAIKGHPPDAACATFAFLLNEMLIAQALIILFTALNAFLMVVKQKQIGLGRFDWRLQLVALGAPLLLGIAGLATKHLGPSGMWCYIDMRRPAGPVLLNVSSYTIILTFTFNLLCYGAVWIKLRQVSHQVAGSKYHRTARIMLVFVAVYMAQWWAYVVYSIWELIGVPHVVIRVCSVSFSNIGGLFNFVAYTLVRRRYAHVQQATQPKTLVAPSGVTNTTLANNKPAEDNNVSQGNM